jgi:valine--pyruvate aminotransferase
MIGNYTTPQGDRSFLEAMANLLRGEYGWDVTWKNIAVVNGSQTAFFLLFNMFAGEAENGRRKKILFPIVPEYIGYADQGLAPDMFKGHAPRMELLGDHGFKYAIDFDTLHVTDDIGAICISRPTNPTGNVVTDDEVARLHTLAKKHTIPLIIDNAYGIPAPNIIFTETIPVWDEHIIHSFSLSKIGLPGTRTSILVASEDIIEKLSGINAIVSLAGNNVGPALVHTLIESGDIIATTKKHITPFYRDKAARAQAHIARFFDSTIPYRVHKAEGALFLWLWFKDIPISSHELYQRLKARSVLVVSGHYFFPGHTENWQHKNECIRISYAQSEEAVEEGIRIIGEEVARVYESHMPSFQSEMSLTVPAEHSQ